MEIGLKMEKLVIMLQKETKYIKEMINNDFIT